MSHISAVFPLVISLQKNVDFPGKAYINLEKKPQNTQNKKSTKTTKSKQQKNPWNFQTWVLESQLFNTALCQKKHRNLLLSPSFTKRLGSQTIYVKHIQEYYTKNARKRKTEHVGTTAFFSIEHQPKWEIILC